MNKHQHVIVTIKHGTEAHAIYNGVITAIGLPPSWIKVHALDTTQDEVKYKSTLPALVGALGEWVNSAGRAITVK
jgi:hypothetical protein